MKITIAATRGEMIDLLTAKMNGHKGAARTATKDEKLRQSGIADGIGEAIGLLEQWDPQPDMPRAAPYGGDGGRLPAGSGAGG